MAKNSGDHTTYDTFPFAKQQLETSIVFGIRELLLLPDAPLRMLLLPALPCGTQKLRCYGEW